MMRFSDEQIHFDVNSVMFIVNDASNVKKLYLPDN